MVQCSKCGFVNKYSGMCKQCGTVNIPPISIGRRISEMCMKQKVLGGIIAGFHTVWLASSFFWICVYVISVILACTMTGDEYTKLLQSAPILMADLPHTVHSYPVFTLIASALIGLIGLAVTVLLYAISLNAVVKLGKAMTILQAYWILSTVFSVYAIGAVSYSLFVAMFFVGVIISLLLILYRKYEFSDN